MRNTIEDICEKLQNKQYTNEEHIRFSLVGRILLELGWDIWNPREVFTEFPAIPSEDSTRVDIALFSKSNITESKFPDVYIEIKSHSGIDKKLGETERQLRDYNRNNQATFTIITDGQRWLFYYSLTQGEFSDRRYLEINLLNNDAQQIEDELMLFLSKESIVSGQAKNRAEEYLRLSHKERAIKDSILDAGKRMDSDPLLNKVQAIQIVLSEKGFEASIEEIIAVLQKEAITPVHIGILQNKPAALLPKPPLPIGSTGAKISNIPPYATTTILKVSVNGKVFQDKDGLNTFKAVLRHWGIERILNDTAIKCKHPLLVLKGDLIRLPKNKYSLIEGNYYVYSNTSTFRKKQFLDMISSQLNENVSVEIIPK